MKAALQIRPFTAVAILFSLILGIGIYYEQLFFVALPFVAVIFLIAWQHPRFFFYLLLFLIPFSIEYQFDNGYGIDFPDELLMWLITGLAIVQGLAKGNPLQSTMNHLIVVLCCWMLWIGVCVLLSQQQFLSIKYLAAKGWYIGAFVIAPVQFIRSRKQLYTSALIILTSMLLVTMIILFRHAAGGFSFATINEAVFPFFRNHVNYSSLLVCMVPLLVACLQLTSVRNVRLIIVFILCAVLIAIYFSYARGAWLAVLVGGIAYLFMKRNLLLKAYILSIGLALIAVFYLQDKDRYLQFAPDYKSTIFHKDFGQHLVATYRLKDLSTAERFYRWVAGVRMIADKPLTGVGPNNFYDHYKSFTIPAYKTWVSNNPERSGVHNYFLLLAIEQGLPGLFIFLILLGVIIYQAEQLRMNTHKHDKIFGTAIGVLTAMIITLNLLSDLVETDKVGSIFFLCIGFLLAYKQIRREECAIHKL